MFAFGDTCTYVLERVKIYIAFTQSEDSGIVIKNTGLTIKHLCTSDERQLSQYANKLVSYE